MLTPYVIKPRTQNKPVNWLVSANAQNQIVQLIGDILVALWNTQSEGVAAKLTHANVTGCNQSRMHCQNAQSCEVGLVIPVGHLSWHGKHSMDLL